MGEVPEPKKYDKFYQQNLNETHFCTHLWILSQNNWNHHRLVTYYHVAKLKVKKDTQIAQILSKLRSKLSH